MNRSASRNAPHEIPTFGFKPKVDRFEAGFEITFSTAMTCRYNGVVSANELWSNEVLFQEPRQTLSTT